MVDSIEKNLDLAYNRKYLGKLYTEAETNEIVKKISKICLIFIIRKGSIMRKNKWKIGITGMALAAMVLTMPATVFGDSAEPAAEGTTVPESNAAANTQDSSDAGSAQNTQGSGQAGSSSQESQENSNTQDTQSTSGQDSQSGSNGQSSSTGQDTQNTSDSQSSSETQGTSNGQSSSTGQDTQNTSDSQSSSETQGTSNGQAAGETNENASGGEGSTEDGEKKDAGDGEKKEDQPDYTADVETEADWRLTLPLELAHEEKALLKEEVTEEDYRSDIVNIAYSQVGYQESEKNYVLNADDEKEFYTRYNDWYGNSYDESWDTEFVCFVLHYAGVPVASYDSDTVDWIEDLAEERSYYAPDLETETGDMIFTASEPFIKNYDGKGMLDKRTASWIKRLADEKKYYHPDYRAQAGDVVFFYEEDEEDPVDKGLIRAGIVAGYVKEKVPNTEDKYIEKMVVIGATVGERRDSVKATRILPDDERIIGYGVVVPETVKKQKLEATVYADSGKKLELNNVRIWLEGELPVGAKAAAYPVVVELEDETTFAAYEVQVIGIKGNEYHSSAEDDRSYTISIENEALTETLENAKNVRCWYMDEDNGSETTDLGYKIAKDGIISLNTDEF